MHLDPELAGAVRPVFLAWLFLFGACLGSFLNVAIFRLPRECMSVFYPRRSFCPTCARQLTWHDNIPILGWLLLRGRCAGCRQPISPRYPLVELGTALLFLWLGLRHLTLERTLDPTAWGLIGVHGMAGAALIVCTGIDIDYRIIPDEVDIPGMLLTPLALLLVPGALGSQPLELGAWADIAREALDSPCAWWGVPGLLGPLEWLAALPVRDPGLHARLAACAASLLGAGIAAGLLWALGEGFQRLLGRESMGFGDVKLAGFLGALVGPHGLGALFLVALVSGSLLGIVHLLRTGRGSLTGAEAGDLGALTPMQRLALRWAVAGPAPSPDAHVPLRPWGPLLLRVASGDPAIPFGPFLALGAAVALYFPGAVPGLLRWWASS